MPRFSVRRAPAMACAIAAALAAAGCRSVPPALGPDAGSARAAVDGLFGGIAARFTNSVRDPRILAARRASSQAWLTPSRVFGTPDAWTLTPDANTRAIAWRGYTENGHYRFSVDTQRAYPARAGDGRHHTQVRRLGGDTYEWFTMSDYGIGPVTPAAMAALPSAWLAGGERADSAAVRAELGDAFGRSARAWGHVFSLKSAQALRDSSGAWRQTYVVTVHADRTAETYPRFAAWLRKYVSPLRLHLRLRDGNRTWFDLVLHDDSLVVHTRTRNGHLLPLAGGDAPLPDTLALDISGSIKVLWWRAGFRAARARFITVRTGDERGWHIRFQQEPDWQLPLFAERMLRTPLRRPFEGEGAEFRIVARTEPGAPQTVLARRLRITLDDSGALRLFARIASAGVGDYVDGADRETNAWLARAFGALAADAAAVLDAQKTRTPPR